MKKNPYSLLFGKEPMQSISRTVQFNEIITGFSDEDSTDQIYMISGVRGSGKTVFMTEIVKHFTAEDDWVVIQLNPERDMLESLAAKLTSESRLNKILKNSSINLSFWGFGVGYSQGAQITDIEVAITKILESLKKHKKRVLIAIDEVTSSKEMRIFSSAFQMFVRDDLPIYLLMTGLYENIEELQNEKTLTFLYRAPKMVLKPLNTGAIATHYEKTFNLDREDALEMARLTNGYPFAFQVLGYLTWDNKGDYKGIIDDYRQNLEEYVYEKIWSEMSAGDRRIAYGIAKAEDNKVSSVRKILGIENGEFNPYRKRLIRKGIINGDKYGEVCFTLPLFDMFVLDNYHE